MKTPYKIDGDKLELVTSLYSEHEPNVTPDLVEAHITDGSWTEGDEHQEWIDNAPAKEIADWVACTVFGDLD